MRLAAALVLLFVPQATDPSADGIKALEQEKYEEAVQAFEQALKKDPKDYGAQFHLALAYGLLGRKSEAIAGYQKVLELKPGLYEAELNLGILLIEEKQLEKAESYLRAALEKKPSEFRPNYYLAEALLEKGNAAGAERHYKTAFEADPKEAGGLAGLGRAIARQGRLDEAVSYFKKAVELDPKYKGVLLELAVLFEQNKQLPEAIEIYKQFPEDAAARERLGQLLLDSGRLEESIEQLQAAVRESPTAANRYALATAYLRNKQLDQATPLLELALQDEPGSFDLRMTYGRILRDQKKFDPAAQEFLRATQLQPKSKEAWSELAGMLILTESHPQALAALDRVEALDPEAASVHFFRAMILDKAQQYKPALASYERFLSMSKGVYPEEEFKARQRVRVIQKELSKR
jgi:tetratricopeptide (TPR) repeat protein